MYVYNQYNLALDMRHLLLHSLVSLIRAYIMLIQWWVYIMMCILVEHIFFRYTRIMEKDPCRGAVYLIVLCDHPFIVSVLFTVLLSLHLITF